MSLARKNALFPREKWLLHFLKENDFLTNEQHFKLFCDGDKRPKTPSSDKRTLRNSMPAFEMKTNSFLLYGCVVCLRTTN